uniref:Uncharacterized protein n=1 Tax=candidate division WWE3 bacterium TaxID=2053526 RepID=A0A7C4TJA0_UNCKA
MNEKKERKRNKRIKNSTLAVTVFFTLIVAILAISFITEHKNENPPKPSSREYFKVENASAWAEAFDSSQNVLKVKAIGFYITPIKGNATDVFIDPGGQIDPIDYYFKQINCNQTEPVDIQYANPTYPLAYKEGELYTITIKIWCAETDWNDKEVTVYFSWP